MRFHIYAEVSCYTASPMLIDMNLQDKPLRAYRGAFNCDAHKIQWVVAHPCSRLVCPCTEVKSRPNQDWYVIHDYATKELRDDAERNDAISREVARKAYSRTYLRANAKAQARWRERQLAQGLI